MADILDWMRGNGTDALQGSTNASLIDDNVTGYIQDPLDRCLKRYRRSCLVIPDSNTTVVVLPGELVLENTGGDIRRMRVNSASFTLTMPAIGASGSDLDTGNAAVTTQYYVYGVADADANTFTGIISTSVSAPTGVTYFRKIGYFYTNESGNIVNVGNMKEGDAGNQVEVRGTTDISTTSLTMTDMTDMEIRFVSTGRPVFISFSAPIYKVDGYSYVELEVDGTTYVTSCSYHHDGSSGSELTVFPFSLQRTITSLTAGTHTIKAQWKSDGGNAVNQKGTVGERVLTAMEL